MSGGLTFNPSIAGVWQYVDDVYVTASNSGDAVKFFGAVRLGPGQLQGFVMTGWQYNGFDTASAAVTPVNLGVLAQQTDGTLRLETQAYVTSPRCDVGARRGAGDRRRQATGFHIVLSRGGQPSYESVLRVERQQSPKVPRVRVRPPSATASLLRIWTGTAVWKSSWAIS